MPVTARWFDDKQQILYFQYEGSWTWEEYRQAMQTGYTLVDQVNYTVAAIIDVSKSNLLPKNAFSDFKSFEKLSHPRIGQMVMVGISNYIIAFMRAFRRVKMGHTQYLMHTVATIDEALALLNQ